MKKGRDSLLRVVAELHDEISTRWTSMITELENAGGNLHSPAADRIVNSDAFDNDRAHRFAAICALVRNLRDYAEQQGDLERFDSVLLSLCKDGKSMHDIMTEVNDRFWTDTQEKEDRW